jgi:hypothetical protein
MTDQISFLPMLEPRDTSFEDNERKLTFKNPKIRIGTGKPEWGAEPGEQYFVITWEA